MTLSTVLLVLSGFWIGACAGALFMAVAQMSIRTMDSPDPMRKYSREE